MLVCLSYVLLCRKDVVSTAANQLVNQERKNRVPRSHFILQLPGYLLGISFLHQGTPELILGVGVAVDELIVECGQAVIDHHVQPLTETPELEVEDPHVALGFLGVPLLLLPVWDDLQKNRHIYPSYSFFFLVLTLILELMQTISKTRKNMKGVELLTVCWGQILDLVLPG